MVVVVVVVVVAAAAVAVAGAGISVVVEVAAGTHRKSIEQAVVASIPDYGSPQPSSHSQ